MTQLEAPPLRGSSRKNHKNSKPHPASKTCENHQGCTGWGKMPTSSDILLNWSISGLPRCCRERGPCHKKWNLHRSMSALPPIVCLFFFCLFVFCSKYVVFTHELTAQFGNLVSYVHLSVSFLCVLLFFSTTALLIGALRAVTGPTVFTARSFTNPLAPFQIFSCLKFIFRRHCLHHGLANLNSRIEFSINLVAVFIIILYLRLIKEKKTILPETWFPFVAPECSNLSCRQDYWSAGRGRPTVDTEQNLTLIDANETNGYTMVDFMRPADTMQKDDLAIMVGRDTRPL